MQFTFIRTGSRGHPRGLLPIAATRVLLSHSRPRVPLGRRPAFAAHRLRPAVPCATTRLPPSPASFDTRPPAERSADCRYHRRYPLPHLWPWFAAGVNARSVLRAPVSRSVVRKFAPTSHVYDESGMVEAVFRRRVDRRDHFSVRQRQPPRRDRANMRRVLAHNACWREPLEAGSSSSSLRRSLAVNEGSMLSPRAEALSRSSAPSHDPIAC